MDDFLSLKTDTCRGCALFKAPMLKYVQPRKADILVIGGVPVKTDIEKGKFNSGSASMVKQMLGSCISKARNKGLQDLHVEYAYAIQCRAADDGAKVTAEDIEYCKPHLVDFISKCDPGIILLLGKDALRGVGITTTVGSLRGNFTNVTVGGKRYDALVSFHPYEVSKSPGLVRIYTMDMAKVVDCAYGGLKLPEMDIRTPISYDEIMAELDALEETINTMWDKRNGAARLVISLDTETSSLYAELPWEKIIMVSLSYLDGVGLAFPWVHKDCFMPDTEYYPIKWRLEEILSSKNEKIDLVEHNRKFDYKWTNLHDGMDLKAPMWDTMLMEHTLDEDKSGEYSLKQLTADYFPGWGKYEEELKQILSGLEGAKEAAYAAIAAEEKRKAVDRMITWWKDKSIPEREAFYSDMSLRGLPILNDARAIYPFKESIKPGQEKPLTKKWKNSVRRLMKKLPAELWPSEIPELDKKGAVEWLLGWWISLEEDVRAEIYNAALSAECADDKDFAAISPWPDKGDVPKSETVWNAEIKRFLKKIPEAHRPSLEVTLPDKKEFTAVTYEEVPVGVLLRYAAIDAVVTRKLAGKQLAQERAEDAIMDKVRAECARSTVKVNVICEPLRWPVTNIDIPLNTLLAEMEFYGVRVDRPLIRRYMEVIDERIALAKDKLMQEVGETTFNPDAPADVADHLFNKKKFPVMVVSEKTDDPSVSKDVIHDLSDMYPDDEFLNVLLAYRQMAKVRNTYLKDWLMRSAWDGKIRASFNQTATATHRLSVTRPALQTVPFSLNLYNPDGATDADFMNLKDVFIPEDGYDIYDLDIANAEVRALTAYAYDAGLTNAFLNGMDLHCLTGTGISEFTYDDLLAHKEDKKSPQYQVRQISKKVAAQICLL